jgi:peptide/nickel transport system substrate-binding protein
MKKRGLAMETKRGIRNFILFILFISLVQYVSWRETYAGPPQGVLKQAFHYAPSADWLDPATCGFTISASLTLYLFHDALVKAMPAGNYTPCLAESYKMSEDSRVCEFKLRKGVKFHNGDTMTAEDVIFSMQRYKGSHAKMLHEKIGKLDAPDPYTVRITFREPFPDFIEYLVAGVSSFAWVVPKKYVEKVGPAGFKKHPIGAGPYKFVEFKPGVSLAGEAFEHYWRKVPSIKRMEIITVRDMATRLAMVRRGEVDVAIFLTGIYYEDAKKDKNIKLLLPMSPTQWVVVITSQWDPKSPWSNPKVRKAASLAIDRQTMADVHMPGCSGIGSLGLEGDPNAVKFPADPYDPAKARKLLAEAGYPNGFHGGIFYPYEGGYWPYGEMVANYWKAVGITMDSKLLDRPAWISHREAGKMKGALFIDPATAPSIAGRLSYLFTSGSYGVDPEVQGLWNQYQKEVKRDVRKDLIARIQKLIYEKTMWIPLTATNSPQAFNPKVKGFPYGIQPLIWYPAPFEDIEYEK